MGVMTRRSVNLSLLYFETHLLCSEKFTLKCVFKKVHPENILYVLKSLFQKSCFRNSF